MQLSNVPITGDLIFKRLNYFLNCSSSVVLDALNINQGYSISTADFVDGVRSLKKKYDVIVLIARHKLANDEKVWNLKQDGIEVFSVGK